MINIKGLFFTTSISFLFGVYSIYSILEYLRVLNNYRVKNVNRAYQEEYSYQKKFIDINKKYIILQKDYDELKINFDQLKEELHLLTISFNELKDDKITTIELAEDKIIELSINQNQNLINEKIICDENCNLEDKNIRSYRDTSLTNKFILNNNKNIDKEFEESLSLEYENNELDSLNNFGHSSKLTRSRSSSISDINWGSLTKKLLFG